MPSNINNNKKVNNIVNLFLSLDENDRAVVLGKIFKLAKKDGEGPEMEVSL